MQAGNVRYIDMNFTSNKKINICTSKAAEIVIEDVNTSLELERYPITIGAKIYFKDGDKVKIGELLAEWDPTVYPFIAEEEGHIEYKDLEPNISYKETVDQFTGLSVREVIQYKDQKLNPALVLVTKDGSRFEYPLPKGSEIRKDNGEKIAPGDFIATLANQKTQTKDITGGLPRVAELFEARKAKDRP